MLRAVLRAGCRAGWGWRPAAAALPTTRRCPHLHTRPATALPRLGRQAVNIRGCATTAAAAAPVLTAEGSTTRVGLWILGCGATVFGMVVLGGVTRLTHSGLTMTEWRLQGTRPPTTAEEWEVEFAKYRQSPEFYMLRPDMTLEEFKPIFWFEYAHRMLGRALGVLFVGPAAYFTARGYIKRSLAPRLAILFAMGGTQGLIGWWMVKSGLSIPQAQDGGGYGGYEIPRVSPYRLATHLSSAFVIYAGIVWTGLTVLREAPLLAAPKITPEQLAAAIRIRNLAIPLAGLVAVTAASGAFVAGMQAGHHFNTFPLMDGRIVPECYGTELQPYWRNFFEHIPTVQFDHRCVSHRCLTIVPACIVVLFYIFKDTCTYP